MTSDSCANTTLDRHIRAVSYTLYDAHRHASSPSKRSAAQTTSVHHVEQRGVPECALSVSNDHVRRARAHADAAKSDVDWELGGRLHVERPVPARAVVP